MVKIPPGVKDTTSIKEANESSRAFPPVIKGFRTHAIQRAIKDGIEVAAENRGESRIDKRNYLIKEQDLTGLRFGAYKDTTRNFLSFATNSHCIKQPSESNHDFTKDNTGR